MKKWLSFALALVMALAICSVSWAEESGQDVEYWTGFSESSKTANSFDTLDEAFAYASSQTDVNPRVVISGEYTLDKDMSIPKNVYLDVMGKLTISEGVTLTIPANAKRLAAWTGGAIVNNGKILVEGRGSNYDESKVMVNGTLSGNALTVPDGYMLERNVNSYFAAKALYEFTYPDGTTLLSAEEGGMEGAICMKLLDNKTGSLSIGNVGENFVLDLNGYTFSGTAESTSNTIMVVSKQITIKSGSIKYVSSTKNCGAILMGGNAVVTIASDVVIDGGEGYGINTGGTSRLTVNGTVKSSGAYAITGNGSESGGEVDECNITVNDGATIKAPNGIGIYHPEKGTVTINGGTISGHTGVQMCAGKLIVNGGTITSTGENRDATGSQNAIQDGAAISVIDRNYPGGTPSLEIYGGTVRATGTGALAVKAYDYKSDKVSKWENAAVKIESGTFSTDPIAYVPDGIPVATVSEDYVVGGKNIADEANSGKSVTVIKAGAITGVKSGVTIEVDKGVTGVTINDKPASEGTTYTVPAAPKYYYKDPATTTDDTTKGSPKTFDAGVGIYAVTAVLSVTGMAWTAKKRH